MQIRNDHRRRRPPKWGPNSKEHAAHRAGVTLLFHEQVPVDEFVSWLYGVWIGKNPPRRITKIDPETQAA